jgi:hypothetical protein
MESKVLICWREGIKVLTTTKCNHFGGEQCGNVNCYFKTKEAKRLFLFAKSENTNQAPSEETKPKKKFVDKGFF